MNKRDLFKMINSTFDDIFSRYEYNYKLPKMDGETKSESGIDETGQWSKTSYTSKDGSITYTSFVRLGDDYPVNSKQDKIEVLKQELQNAIEKQEFEKAAEFRDRIKLLEKNSQTINELKNELRVLVENQEFEKAAKVRDKIKELEK